jgi:hypothetical protein
MTLPVSTEQATIAACQDMDTCGGSFHNDVSTFFSDNRTLIHTS